MATLSLITGRVLLPDDTPPVDGILKFVLSGVDTDGVTVIAPYEVKFALEANGDIPAGCEIYINGEGLRGTIYTVFVYHSLVDAFGVAATWIERKLGTIQINTAGPHDLTALLNAGAPTVPGTWVRSITEEEYNAAIAAAATATAAAAVLEGFAVPTWGTFTTDSALTNGRGPYALPYDPGNVAYVDLTVGGISQVPTTDFTLTYSGATAQILLAFDMPSGAVCNYRLQRPIPYDPNATVFTPEQFQTNGETDGEAIVAALGAANGKLVKLREGKTYNFAEAYEYIGHSVLDASGAIFAVSANVIPLTLKAPSVGPFFLTADYDPVGSPLLLQVSGLTEAPKAGQVIWIASKARVLGERDNGSASGQYRTAEAVRLGYGSTTTDLVLQAPLTEYLGVDPVSAVGDEPIVLSYTTAYSAHVVMPDMDARCDIKAPIIEFEDGHNGDGWSTQALAIWAYVNGHLEGGGVKRGYGAAIRLWGTYDFNIERPSLANLTDNAPTQVGYGVADGGWNTRINGLSSHNGRHAYTTSKATGSFTLGGLDAYKAMTFGVTSGAIISNSHASGGSSAIWDTHQDAQNVIFDTCIAENGGAFGFGIRGRNICLISPIILNCLHGIEYFNEYDGSDPDDDKYNNSKRLQDFTSGMVTSPRMNVRGRCFDVRAATLLVGGVGRCRTTAGCVDYVSGGTLVFSGSQQTVVDGDTVPDIGAALMEIEAANIYSSSAFPMPAIVIEDGCERQIDATGWTGPARTALKTATGTRIIVRGVLRLLLPAGSTLFSGGNEQIVCEGRGRIEYSIAGSSTIVTGLSARPIYLVELNSGAVMDGTTRRNQYFGYSQVTDFTANTMAIRHGGGAAAGLILRDTDTSKGDGEGAGGLTCETNDTSNAAFAAARILFEGVGSLGYVATKLQRNGGAGLVTALRITQAGYIDMMLSDGTTVGFQFDPTTGFSRISPPGPYADDAAAGAAGVTSGRLYRVTGGAVAWKS